MRGSGRRAAVLAIPLAAGWVSVPPAAAQSEHPKFEVTSIKSCRPRAGDEFGGGGRGRGSSVDPGRLRLECRTLEMLIVQAYLAYQGGGTASVSPDGEPLVEGGPGWVRSEGYTIDAKSESAQTAAIMRGPMLQALLEDRFRLKIRRVNRKAPAYALVVTKGGPRLRPTAEGSCTTAEPDRETRALAARGQAPPCGAARGGGGGVLQARGWDMAALCRALSARLGEQVIDKTGLTGTYDVRLDTSAQEAGGSLTGPLQKLGLKLERAEGSVEVLAIEHVERPTEN